MQCRYLSCIVRENIIFDLGGGGGCILRCQILQILIAHHSDQKDESLVTITMTLAGALRYFFNHCNKHIKLSSG